MDENQRIYKDKNLTVEVERFFTGDKTAKEKLIEILKKEIVLQRHISDEET